jgi:hypothetical protein
VLQEELEQLEQAEPAFSPVPVNPELVLKAQTDIFFMA